MNAPVELQTGDVLFYAPSDLIGLLIAVKTWTWLAHVEVCVSPGKVLAARIEGVNIYSTRVDKYLVAVRRPDPPFFAATAMATADILLGQSYEIPALERFFNPWSHRRRASRICSSVVTVYEEAGGSKLFNPDVDASAIAPAQLWQTPGLKTIWAKGHWLKRTLRLQRPPPR